MLCSNCGRENRAEAAFCDSCGASLHAPPVHAEELFVGRERELAMVRTALEQTIAGRGRVLMISGEPGIGKTRTAQAFTHYAEQRQVQVLWGRCYEEPGAPPYWPWLQAIRGYLETQDDASLQANLGNAAAEIVPEIAQHLPDLPSLLTTSDAAQARFRLFDAITGFWKRAAAERPLALIFDNLHWADTPSLKLLEFLASELAASRLFVLGTYRDVELTRQHPLSNTLGELARHSGFQRLRLTGLSFNETRQLMSNAAGQSLPSDLITEIHTLTEGNPLFLAEMTRFLLHEGVLGARRDSRYAGRSRRRIPEGVREVIGARLNHLSLTCNRVLAAAAVIGRSFSAEVLNRMLDDMLDDECLAALEEALTAGVIEELPEAGTYQFHHALIRETLYDEMPALKRTRLHQRIGVALEALHGDDLTGWLSALAHHYSAALPGGDPVKAVEYAHGAGERADALLAYEEAARFYGLVLRLQSEHFPHDRDRRCQLLLKLGRAQNSAGASEPCLDTFLEAATLARELGSAPAFAQAALGFESGGWRISRHGKQAAALLEEALALPDRYEECLQVNLLSALCRAYIFCDHSVGANAAYRRAVALARRLDDPYPLFKALAALVPASWPDQLDGRLAAAREALALAEQAGHPEWAVADLTGWYFPQLAEQGHMDRARAVLATHAKWAETMRQPFLQAAGRAGKTLMAIHEGRFAEAEVIAGETLAIARRVSPDNAAGAFGMQMFTLRREQGRLAEVLPVLRHFVQTTPKTSTWRPGLALLYAELCMSEEARAEFETLAAEDFAAIAHDAMRPTSIAYMAEVCIYLNDARRAAILYRLMQPYGGRNVVAGNVACYGAADRFLGMLAATLEQFGTAERHFEAALAMDRNSGGRPWLAHSQYDYAAMLLARGRPGDREHAESLCEEALAISREVGMRALEQRLTALRQQAQSQRGRQRYPAGLSRREVQVLRLVTAGKGNREIANRLFVSENTVANHMRSILAKTNTANRTEAAAFATRHGLLDDSPERA